MKRVYIVVEGPTEQEFVNSVVSPYLQDFGILNVTPILVRTSRTGRGGMVNYSHLSNTIRPLLISEKSDYIVTTFIDFFRIPHNMPEYDESMRKPSKIEQVESLENAINEDINDGAFFLIYNCTNLKLYCFQVIKALSIISQTNFRRKRLL